MICLKTNSRENIEITVETARMKNSGIASQMSKNLDEWTVIFRFHKSEETANPSEKSRNARKRDEKRENPMTDQVLRVM